MKWRKNIQKTFSRQTLDMQMSESVRSKVKRHPGAILERKEKGKEWKWLLKLRKVNR